MLLRDSWPTFVQRRPEWNQSGAKHRIRQTCACVFVSFGSAKYISHTRIYPRSSPGFEKSFTTSISLFKETWLLVSLDRTVIAISRCSQLTAHCSQFYSWCVFTDRSAFGSVFLWMNTAITFAIYSDFKDNSKDLSGFNTKQKRIIESVKSAISERRDLTCLVKSVLFWI